jgi:hypothetical protein
LSTDETAQVFPCTTFKCLIEKYEVMKTGFLLNSLPSQSVNDECTNLSCWLKRFKISKTSYGYQLTNKAVIEDTSNSPASTPEPLSTTQSTLQPLIPKVSDPTVASVSDFEEMFGDYFY